MKKKVAVIKTQKPYYLTLEMIQSMDPEQLKALAKSYRRTFDDQMSPEQREDHAEYERRAFGEQMMVLAMDKHLCKRIKGFIKLTTAKTSTERAAEVVALEDLRRSFPGGAGVHDMIAAQIRVLSERMMLRQVCDQFEDGNGNVMDAALDAWRWAHGELWDRYDPFSPSTRWAAQLRRSKEERLKAA